MSFWIALPLVVLAAAAMTIYLCYNRLMALDQRCETAFSDVDVQLKHRHNVIPNLVETVRGYVGHERAILDQVLDSRKAALASDTPAARLAAEAKLGETLATLMTSMQAYPNLQATTHFRDLRVEIGDAENKIAAARRFFNLAVEEYNTTLRQFPGNLLGGFFRLGRRPTYDIGVERVLIEEPATIRF